MREIIGPALAAGSVVLCDRFLDSTTVYQGVARRLDSADVEQMNRFAAGGRLPDVTFLLDLPPAAAFARLRRRPSNPGAPDRMEQEPLAFYERVRAGYLDLAATSARFVVVDATPEADEIEQVIWNQLAQRIHGLRAPGSL